MEKSEDRRTLRGVENLQENGLGSARVRRVQAKRHQQPIHGRGVHVVADADQIPPVRTRGHGDAETMQPDKGLEVPRGVPCGMEEEVFPHAGR